MSNITFTLSDYTLGKCIGQGSSALVFSALHIPTNKYVALKVIDLDMFERNQIDELRSEIQIMNLSRHLNLLPVHGSFVDGSKLYIVTPLLTAGSCLDIIKTQFKDGFDEVTIATILKQALAGLDYLHKSGLIHRDVKAGNLLVDNDGLVQLADFGVSSSLMESGDRRGVRKTFVGTPSWMSPEVMEQSGYDYKADIWSFGITCLELAMGHAPYAKYPPLKVLMLTLQNEPPTLDRSITKHKYSKTFKDMIDLCLQKDPSKRPSAEKLLLHSFFRQAKKPSFLVQSILENLPDLEKRDRKTKEFQQDINNEKRITWDFSSDAGSSIQKNSTISSNITNLKESEIDVSLEAAKPAETQSVKEKSSLEDLAQEIDHSPNSTTSGTSGSKLPGAQIKRGRFSIMEKASSMANNDFPTTSTDSQLDGNITTTSNSTLERKMGRFAIQTSSPRLDAGENQLTSAEVRESIKPVSSRFQVSTDSALANTNQNSPASIADADIKSSPSRFKVSAANTVGDVRIEEINAILSTEKNTKTIESVVINGGEEDTVLFEQIAVLLKGPDLRNAASLQEMNQILLMHSEEQKSKQKMNYGLNLKLKQKNLLAAEHQDKQEHHSAALLLKHSQSTISKVQVEKTQEALLEDPTVFEYDKVYDSIKQRQQFQKQQRDLPLENGRKQSRYVQSIQTAANRRKLDYEIANDKRLAKIQALDPETKESEKFVTSAYLNRKKELEEIQKQQKINESKQKPSSSVDFYKGILAARSRGFEEDYDYDIDGDKSLDKITNSQDVVPNSSEKIQTQLLSGGLHVPLKRKQQDEDNARKEREKIENERYARYEQEKRKAQMEKRRIEVEQQKTELQRQKNAKESLIEQELKKLSESRVDEKKIQEARQRYLERKQKSNV